MWQAWAQGDRKAAVAAIPAQVVDALIPRGSMAEIRARIRRYFEAGLDTAFLSLHTSEPDPAKRREVLRGALRALSAA